MPPDFSQLLSSLPAPPPFLRDALGQVETVLAHTPLSDLQKSVRAVVKESAQKINLMTRDEFEVQGKIIERLITRIEALEARIAQLEKIKG